MDDPLAPSAEPAPSTAAPLEYAPRPPVRRRRWFGRLVLAFVLLAIAAAAALWGRQVFERGLLLYHQRACMNYTAPPDQVVFDSDPARVAKLANDPNFIISGGCAFRRLPGDWNAISAHLGAIWANGSPRALVFLHEMHTDGGPWLVSVERTAVVNESAYFLDGYDVAVHLIQPAGITHPLKNVPRLTFIDVMDSMTPHTDIRIYAGQPDPADPSHFTIRYESRGGTHLIDGHLGANGSLTLHRRHEPADGPGG